MEFPPKLRPKKGWKQQPEEAPFPVPIQSLTSKTASDGRWFYYTAQLVNGSVIVQSDGDSHFLYKMGFFGKGIFSRGKPEHARMMSSFQGIKRKSLPASERRFQQERFQKVRQHRYEQHLSWKKMKDAELKVKAEKEKVLTKEESAASTTKREQERELGWENVPSTSSVQKPLFYARTASSNDSSGGDRTPLRHLKAKFPSFTSDSGSEVSSVRSLEGSPRVPPQGNPLEEGKCDLKQTLGENVGKEASSLGQWVDLEKTGSQRECAPGTVEENVKKKETKTWLTDAADWNLGSETELVLKDEDEKISGGTDVRTDKERATLGVGEESRTTLETGEESHETLESDVGKGDQEEATITEQSEVTEQVMESVRTDSDTVAKWDESYRDTRSVPKRKSRSEKEDTSPGGVAKKRRISDQDEESSGTPEKSEQKIKPSQMWQVNKEQWAITEEKVASVDVAAEEGMEKGGMTGSEPVREEESGKEAVLEREDVSDTVNVGETSDTEQDENIDVRRNLPDESTDRLTSQGRTSQEEDEDDGEEADTEEDVVRDKGDDGGQKSQSEEVKGDSLKQSSKKKTLVRKPDPYPVREFLQLSYEEAFFLSYGLGCLSLYKYSPTVSKEKPMDLCGMWLEFLTLKPRFVATYACYHYYRSKGWVPQCGIKYGCDFVVYRKGPSFYHSSFAVLAQLVSEDSENVTALTSWSRFTGFSRMVENAAKDVLLCFVSYPENFTKMHLRSPACIPHLEVQEIWVKRWRPSRGRTGKDFPSLIS